MCVLVYTDAALHNADADPDEEGSDDEWLAKAQQKGIRVRPQHGALVCVVFSCFDKRVRLCRTRCNDAPN